MWKRVWIICVTVLFWEICLILINNDSLISFMPFSNILYKGYYKITLYDVLFILAILTLRMLYQRYRKNPITELKQFWAYITDFRQPNLTVLIVTILAMHVCLWPSFYRIIYPLLDTIRRSSDSIRRIVIIILPPVWLLIISSINTTARTYPPPQQQTPGLPPPPPW